LRKAQALFFALVGLIWVKAMREHRPMQTWTNSSPHLVAATLAVTGDAMAYAIELAELFDVDMDQLRRDAHIRSGAPVRGSKATELSGQTLGTRAHRGRRGRRSRRRLPCRLALAAQRFNRSTSGLRRRKD